MTPAQLQAIDDFQTAGILWACRAMDASIAAGDTDRAISFCALALNRYHARRFDRMIDSVQAALKTQHHGT